MVYFALWAVYYALCAVYYTSLYITPTAVYCCLTACLLFGFSFCVGDEIIEFYSECVEYFFCRDKFFMGKNFSFIK